MGYSAANAKIITQIAGIYGKRHICLEHSMHVHIQMYRHILCVATLNCILLKKYVLKIVMREVTAAKHDMWLHDLNFSNI